MIAAHIGCARRLIRRQNYHENKSTTTMARMSSEGWQRRSRSRATAAASSPAPRSARTLSEIPQMLGIPRGGTPTRTSGSSIYPAVQNMLLAARALGLGATLTTLYLSFEKEVEAALGLPADVHSYALLPIGYPMGRFGSVRRMPLADVVYEDRWGQPYSGPSA